MRFGIIDLGTNSVRFDVHQVGPEGQAKLLHREKLMVRLGQGVFIHGRLNADARRRTLQAFRSFARTCDDLSVKRILAFGTSALREANDKSLLIDEIRRVTGIEVKVISGAEEARLISRGVLAHELRAKGRFALIDIGGGSTEISICRGRQVLHAESFPLGTARLQQVFLKSSPPDQRRGADPIKNLRLYIRSLLTPKMRGERWPKVDWVLGSSGTIKVIYRMLRKSGAPKRPPKKGVSKLVSEMETMSSRELLRVPGMEAKRVDMILAGAILFEECLEAVGAKSFSFTPYALRDGVLDEEVELVASHQKSHLGLHMEDLVAKARRCGVHEGHLQSVREMSLLIFDRLKSIHGLKNEWRPFLEAAAILHDVGEVVNPAHHGRHSYYVAKNLDLPALDSWELEFVAQLCLWHAGGKPDLRDFPELRGKQRQQAFLKLLAILRVADALDRSHQAKPGLREIQLKRGAVLLKLNPRKSSDLEVLRVEQKKDLFEEVFRRKLEVKRSR